MTAMIEECCEDLLSLVYEMLGWWWDDYDDFFVLVFLGDVGLWVMINFDIVFNNILVIFLIGWSMAVSIPSKY